MQNLQQSLKRNWLWFLYAAFCGIAIYYYKGESIFFSEGPYALGKPLVWIVLIAFLIYSVRISLKENFFKSLARMNPILWSRQIGLDLYIGLMFPLFVVYLNEGSLVVMLFWFVPIFIFANLATLLYLALNYDSIVAYFI